MAGAAGAVVAADAEVAVYSAAVASKHTKKGACGPLFRMLGCARCQIVRECVFAFSNVFDKRADSCNERVRIGVRRVSALRDAAVWRRMGPDRRLLVRTRAIIGSNRVGPWQNEITARPPRTARCACWLGRARVGMGGHDNPPAQGISSYIKVIGANRSPSSDLQGLGAKRGRKLCIFCTVSEWVIICGI